VGDRPLAGKSDDLSVVLRGGVNQSGIVSKLGLLIIVAKAWGSKAEKLAVPATMGLKAVAE
jgi:hypothetical protein